MNTESDLISLVTTSLPEVIAAPVSRWSGADTDEQLDPLRRVKHIWEVLERTDAFLGLLAALEYVRDGNATTNRDPVQRAEADHLVDQLCSGGLISWGNWKELRRECVRAFDADQDRLFCRPLADLDRKLRSHGERDALARRNASQHGGAGSPDHDKDNERACRGELVALLVEVGVLAAYRLVRVLANRADPQGDGRGAAGSSLLVEDLTGAAASRPRYWLDGVRPHGRPPKPGELALLSRGAGSGWRALALYPLYAWLPGPDDGEVAQYEGRAHNKYCYLGLRTGSHHKTEPGHRFEEALSRQPGALKSALDAVKGVMSPGWKHALAAARELSGDLLDRVREERVYVPAAFIERKQAGERIGQFLDAAVREAADRTVAGGGRTAPRLLLVTGMAGAGKTSFLCRLAESLQECWELVPVILVTAARLESLEGAGRGGSLGLTCLQWLGLKSEEQLRKELAGVAALARKERDLLRRERERSREGRGPAYPPPAPAGTDGRPPGPEVTATVASCLREPLTAGLVVLLIDGIDRTGVPGDVLEHLHRVVETTPGFVCVATIARPILQGLAAQCAGWRGLARFGDAGADDLAVSVGALDDADAEKAWERYRKQPEACPLTPWGRVNPSLQAAARNPLLLRLACEAYHGREVPRWANEIDVLQEHAHRHIWKDYRRAHFVREVVRCMWAEGARPTRRLKLVTILSNPDLRESALDPSGPLAGLERDHVLVRVPISDSGPYNAPDYAVEFAFDALLGYLLFALVGKESDGEDSPDRRVVGFARHAGVVAPLGYSMDLVLRAAFVTGRGQWVECVRRLLAPDSAGSVPETSTSCVARFLAWVYAQRPPHSRAFVAAMGHGGRADEADPVVGRASALFASIREEYKSGAGAPGGSDLPPEESSTPDVIAVAGQIFGSDPTPHPTAVRAIAEHLADRRLPVLAGFLADRLLDRLRTRGQSEETADTLAALRLRAAALLQEGSVESLRAALEQLPDASDKARKLRAEAEYRHLQRLVARIHYALGEVDEALQVVDRLLDYGGHAREWNPETHAENLLLRTELLLAKSHDEARVGLDIPSANAGPRPAAPKPGWEEWWGFVRTDLNAVCRAGTKLRAWRAEVEARIAGPTLGAAGLVAAVEEYQAVGATAEVARTLACLTEWTYEAGGTENYKRAVEYGQRARTLADAIGEPDAWSLAAAWEARAMARMSLDATAAAPFRLATEALRRAFDLGRPLLLARSLTAVFATSTENSRHTIAAEAQGLVIDVYEHLRRNNRVKGPDVAYHLEDWADALIDVGRGRDAIDAGNRALAYLKEANEKPAWTAVFLARALANQAMVDPENRAEHAGRAVELLAAFESGNEMMSKVRYRWQYARAEVLARVAGGDIDTAADRLRRQLAWLDEQAEKDGAGPEEALACAITRAWLALVVVPSNSFEAADLAEDAHKKLGFGRGLQHRAVASYAAVLAHRGKYDLDKDSRHLDDASHWLSEARAEVKADYPEFYAPGNESNAAGRLALEAGNVIVRCVLLDDGFPPRGTADVSSEAS